MVVIESIAAGVAITATTHHYAKSYTVHSRYSKGTQFLDQTLEELEKYGKNYEPSSRQVVSQAYNKSVFYVTSKHSGLTCSIQPRLQRDAKLLEKSDNWRSFFSPKAHISVRQFTNAAERLSKKAKVSFFTSVSVVGRME